MNRTAMTLLATVFVAFNFVVDGSTSAVIATADNGTLRLMKSARTVKQDVTGSIIEYVIHCVNMGSKTLTRILIVDPVPRGTSLDVNSVGCGRFPAGVEDVVVEFSDDYGASWTYEPSRTKAAIGCNLDSEVTTIRWRVIGQLDPGEQSIEGLVFRVHVR